LVSQKQRETKLCGKRLKVFLLSLGLSLLSPFVPLCSYSYADVILTDEEATELMDEIQQSKMELQTVKDELKTSKEELKQSKEELKQSKSQLEDVKNTYTEQKQSYETQLEEAEKEKNTLKTWLTMTATSSVCLLGVTLLLLLL